MNELRLATPGRRLQRKYDQIAVAQPVIDPSDRERESSVRKTRFLEGASLLQGEGRLIGLRGGPGGRRDDYSGRRVGS